MRRRMRPPDKNRAFLCAVFTEVQRKGIVLRHADYREHDRMLTLLSPTLGRVEALCRGCKRLGSPLLPASELFALGDFELFSGKGRMTPAHSCRPELPPHR